MQESQGPKTQLTRKGTHILQSTAHFAPYPKTPPLPSVRGGTGAIAHSRHALTDTSAWSATPHHIRNQTAHSTVPQGQEGRSAEKPEPFGLTEYPELHTEKVDAHTITHIPIKDNSDLAKFKPPACQFHNTSCSQRGTYPVDIYYRQQLLINTMDMPSHPKAIDTHGNYFYTPHHLALDLCRPVNHVDPPAHLQQATTPVRREELLKGHADWNLIPLRQAFNTVSELDTSMRDTIIFLQKQTCPPPWPTQKLCRNILCVKYIPD